MQQPDTRQALAMLAAFASVGVRSQAQLHRSPARSNSVKLIQLDDLDNTKAERVAPHAFLVLHTSPGNFQAWLAVKDAPEDFARRLRQGAGADPTASGATRMSGSVNFKPKYAPEFPRVELRQVNAGKVTTTAALNRAGVVAQIGRAHV
jgi:hypothetical protein